MIRKALTVGFLGLFATGIGAGVFGMVDSLQAKPGKVAKKSSRFVVDFTDPVHGVAASLTFDTRAEAEKFAHLKQTHGYVVRVVEAD